MWWARATTTLLRGALRRLQARTNASVFDTKKPRHTHAHAHTPLVGREPLTTHVVERPGDDVEPNERVGGGRWVMMWTREIERKRSIDREDEGRRRRDYRDNTSGSSRLVLKVCVTLGLVDG